MNFQQEMVRGQTATMCALVAVAGIFAEVLVRKGLLSADEAKGVLCSMAEEIRDDGDRDGGKTAAASFAIANALDSRAINPEERLNRS